MTQTQRPAASLAISGSLNAFDPVIGLARLLVSRSGGPASESRAPHVTSRIAPDNPEYSMVQLTVLLVVSSDSDALPCGASGFAAVSASAVSCAVKRVVSALA